MVDVTREYLIALKPYFDRQVEEGVREAFDTCCCPNCGDRRKSLNEVRQVERDECCLYACTQCDATVSETPF